MRGRASQDSNWDYILVGAGSAGCAVTHELVMAGYSVLLLEAGGSDWSPFIRVASGQPKACEDHDWGFWGEPDPTRNRARENWKRGRVLGGSSSINGTLYSRGGPYDFDRWNLPGWSWDDVVPLYRELEGADQPGALRGHDGPLRIRTVRRPHPVSRAFVESAQAAQHRFSEDFNAEVRDGVAYAQLTQRGGFRCSASDAFVKPLLGRRNLQVKLRAHVTRLDIADGRVRAVLYRHGGKEKRATAREIILCAGVINTPQLLMLSGVGEADELRRHEIDVHAEIPAVGRNLKEHPFVSMIYNTRVPTHNLTEGPVQQLAIAAEFARFGEGPISNLFEAVGFFRSSPEFAHPDLQIIFLPFGLVRNEKGYFELAKRPSIMVEVLCSYPQSIGRVRLRNNDPASAPIIECRLLDHDADIAALAGGVGEVRRVMSAPPIADMIESEATPGPDVQSREEILAYLRRATGISMHPIGTCRMGGGEDCVVDTELRVRGIEGLRIADASVIPEHMSANMNAVCILIGKKLGKLLTAQRT